LEKNPPAFAGQVGFGMPEKFRAAENTTCSVRLNRESSYGRIAVRRLRRAVVRELLLPSLRDSDFAKIEGCNKL